MSKRVLNAILTGVGITVFLGVVVLSGSLLSNIRDAFRRADTNKRPNQSLGVTKLDRGAWEKMFGRLPRDFDRNEFSRTLPEFDPPLSQTVIQQRDEER